MNKENNRKNSFSNLLSNESEDKIRNIIESNNKNNLLKFNSNKKDLMKKRNSKRIAIQGNENIVIDYINLSQEQFYRRGLELFRNEKRDFNQNQIVIEFLMNLNPFAQGIKEVRKVNYRDLFSSLSFTLKHKFLTKNKIIYKYNDELDNFYLVLKGRVDILVPNEEYIKLTEPEYFIYLLKLRKYNEYKLLEKTLNKNNSKFPMNEQNFDIWIKRAYITIINYNIKMNIRNKNELKNNSIMRRSSVYNKRINHNYFPIKTIVTFQPKNSNSNNIFNNILPFESHEERDLALSIQDEIIETFKFIENNKLNSFFENLEREKENISSEEYINRIKPIFKNNQEKNCILEKKDILISNYFLAQSLSSGEKFGEGLSDISYLNNNKRVETIITSKDTDLAYFSIEQYNDILREISEKSRREKMNFLLNLALFKNNDKYNNLKTFTNYFKQKICKYKEVIYLENNPYEKKHFIYFIQNGEFETKANKNINEIDEILNCTPYKYKLSEINDIENAKEFFIQKEFKLETFGVNDIMGLSDCVYNNKYLFTVSCKTNHSIIYEINITFFKMLLNISPIIKERLIKMQKVKNNIITNLLYKQRESLVDIIRTKYKFENNSKKNLKYSAKKLINKVQRPLSERKEISVKTLIKHDSQKTFFESNTIKKRIHLRQKSDEGYFFKGFSKKKNVYKNLDIDILMRNDTTNSTSKYNHYNKTFRTISIGLNSKSFKSFKKSKNLEKNKFDDEFKKMLLEKDKKIKILPKQNSQISIFKNRIRNVINPNLNCNNFLNPLIYDDFNRNYNTFRYFKPKKDDLKDSLYRLEIFSAMKKKSYRLISGRNNSNVIIRNKNKFCISK